MIRKNFDTADQSTKMTEKVTVDTVIINDVEFRRLTCQPGWRWSIDLKPIFNTESCTVDHLLYMISGKMGVRMDDGQELEFDAGDMAAIPSGHDGWGIGDEPTVWLEIPH
jgi:hypothetical protein